jgi:hypothetical protein
MDASHAKLKALFERVSHQLAALQLQEAVAVRLQAAVRGFLARRQAREARAQFCSSARAQAGATTGGCRGPSHGGGGGSTTSVGGASSITLPARQTGVARALSSPAERQPKAAWAHSGSGGVVVGG